CGTVLLHFDINALVSLKPTRGVSISCLLLRICRACSLWHGLMVSHCYVGFDVLEGPTILSLVTLRLNGLLSAQIVLSFKPLTYSISIYPCLRGPSRLGRRKYYLSVSLCIRASRF
ncbi:hypothetical protein LY76DRAFT_676562, partial [Colletotrichum caudatum]